MRLVVLGTWRAHACTVTWEEGHVTTDPPELLPLFRLHTCLHTEGLGDGADGVDEEAWKRGERGLVHPFGVLDLARSLLDAIVIVEDTLGPWKGRGCPCSHPGRRVMPLPLSTDIVRIDRARIALVVSGSLTARSVPGLVVAVRFSQSSRA